MNEIECLAIAILLFKRILERFRERGYLTIDEKTQIFKTIGILSRRILYKFSQVGELTGQFEMPRIQHCYLEEKCAYTDDK